MPYLLRIIGHSVPQAKPRTVQRFDISKFPVKPPSDPEPQGGYARLDIVELEDAGDGTQVAVQPDWIKVHALPFTCRAFIKTLNPLNPSPYILLLAA